MDDKRYNNRLKHESFGMAQFNRVNGSHKNELYGSSVQSNNFITFRVISSSTYVNEFGHRMFESEGAPIIEIAMTANQFSELITNMNVGFGVPCTIRNFNHKEISANPKLENDFTEAVKVVNEEMTEHVQDVTSDINELYELMNKSKTVTKELKEKMKRVKDDLNIRLPRNQEFYLNQVQKVSDKIKQSAKSELDAMVTHTLMSTGIDALNKLKIENKE